MRWVVVTFSIAYAIGPPSKHIQGIGEIYSEDIGSFVHFSLEILEVRPVIPTGRKILANHAVLMVNGENYVCSGPDCYTYISGTFGRDDFQATVITNDGLYEIEVNDSGFSINGTEYYNIYEYRCTEFVNDKGPPFELCWPRIDFRCFGPR